MPEAYPKAIKENRSPPKRGGEERSDGMERSDGAQAIIIQLQRDDTIKITKGRPQARTK